MGTAVRKERAGEVLNDLRSADEALLRQRAHRLSVRVGASKRVEGGAIVPECDRLCRIFALVDEKH